MNKKSLYSILSVVVAMIVLSVTLVLAIGPRVSADSLEDVGVIEGRENYIIDEDGVLTGLSYNVADYADEHEYLVLVIPDGVREIQHFEVPTKWKGHNNGHVVSVVLPDGLEVIGDNAFGSDWAGDFGNLKSINIPSTVTEIQDGAFAYCFALKSIFIPENVEYMGNSVFYGYQCNIYCEVAGRPESWDYDFRGTKYICMSIVDNSYDSAVYWNCKLDGNIVYQLTEDEDAYALIDYIGDVDNVAIATEINHLPVTTIDYNAFAGYTSLTSITIPDSVTSIGDAVFEGCTNLSRVTLGNGVKTIGSYAFHNCKSLTSIIIPASVERVEGAVFTGCKELYTVYCECPQSYAEENWSEYWGNWDEEDDGDWRDFRNLCEWNYVIPEYTVTFNTDGGNNIAEQIVRVDNLITKPTAPTKAGYTFKGWFIGDDEYDFATPVTEDMTLTAKWEAVQAQPEPETPADENAEVNNQNNAGLIWGIAGTSAGVLIIAGVVVGIVIAKRRRK